MKFRNRLVVNLSYLKHNYSLIKKMSLDTEVIFMVKADGYGHGMIQITRFAILEMQIKEFGCASIAEALKLREELHDLEFDIYVFSDTQLDVEENFEIYSKRRIIPIISSLGDLEFFIHSSESRNIPVCLKFNTGMNRLGLDPDDAEKVIKTLKQQGRQVIHHLFAHFANASFDMSSDERNIFQNATFLELKQKFLDSGLTLERTSKSNSGAIEQKIGGETHIRPGLMMYGPTSLSSDISHKGHFNGKQVSRLETYIIRTFEVKAGTPIGYGSTVCPEDGLVAILAIGYGDGFSTRNSGAHIYHKGFEGKIIGRVNMDMIQVLFPIEARSKIFAHDVVAIWGEKEGDLLKFSEETKTIPYELFCSLLPRVPRVYRIE